MPSILFQIMRAPPHRGGQITYLKYILAELYKRNLCEPCIIYSHRMRERYIDHKINMKIMNNKLFLIKQGLPYSPYSLDSIVFKPLQLVLDKHKLSKIIRKYDVDVLHVIGPGPEYSISLPPSSHISFSPIKSNKPKVVIANTPWDILARYKDLKKIYTLFDSPFITPSPVFYMKALKIIDIFDIIIVHLKESYLFLKILIKELGYNYTKKLKLIPYGINLQMFNPRKYRSIRSIDEAVLKRELHLLCPARIAPEKNQEVILFAIHILSKILSNYKITCTLVGSIQDNIYYNYLLNIIKRFKLNDKVKIIGEVPYSDMPKIYASHDIVILSSTRELLSSAVLEAMAMERVVICPRLPSMKLVYTENVHCLMFNPRDVGELVRRILQVIRYPRAAVKISRNARMLIEKYFSLEKMINDTLKVYLE